MRFGDRGLAHPERLDHPDTPSRLTRPGIDNGPRPFQAAALSEQGSRAAGRPGMEDLAYGAILRNPDLLDKMLRDARCERPWRRPAARRDRG
jgi:hypothetical protein